MAEWADQSTPLEVTRTEACLKTPVKEGSTSGDRQRTSSTEMKEAGTRSLSRGEVEYEQASCGVGA